MDDGQRLAIVEFLERRRALVQPEIHARWSVAEHETRVIARIGDAQLRAAPERSARAVRV